MKRFLFFGWKQLIILVKKILILHSFYGKSAPSGENSAVKEDHEYLKSLGYEVELIKLESDELNKYGFFKNFIGAIYYLTGIRSIRLVTRICKKFKPDVIHIHNLFPMFSLWILFFIKRKARVIYTFHNYRNYCIAGYPYKNNSECTLCFNGSQFHGFYNKCYRNNTIASAVQLISNSIHLKLNTINRTVNTIVCFTNFQKSVLIDLGIKENLITIKPNISNINSNITIPWNQRKDKVSFVGRLDNEKGIAELLEIWNLDKKLPILEICGDGPLYENLKNQYNNIENIVFLGYLKGEDLVNRIKESKAIIVPSRRWEGYPMVIADAIKLKIPVIGSDVGPMKELCKNIGVSINFNNKIDCLNKLYRLIENKFEKLNYIYNDIKTKNKFQEYFKLYETEN